MKLVLYSLIFTSILNAGCKKFQLQNAAAETRPISMMLDGPLDGYTLAWADEFDAATLDTTTWKYRIGVSQQSYQRAENVGLTDGKLIIDLKTENFGGKTLTGGGIITNNPSGYGYYEVSAKLDDGYGWHEAFWTTGMSGFDDPNPIKDDNERMLEIDCFEHYGEYDVYNLTYGAIEWGPYHGNVNRDYHTSPTDLSAGYHTYGFEYTPDYLNYYFDGSLLKTVDMRGVPQHDFYLWLSAIATKADATSSGQVFFDYIRAYEISPAAYDLRKTEFISGLDSLRGPTASSGTDLWIEAEDFLQKSNWTVERDVQNSLVMKGFSSYNAARDSSQLRARTGITVNTAGTYKLWVRSRDFSTAPGTRKFKVMVNGVTSATEFGTHSIDGYAWQSGGTFTLAAGESVLDLYDSSQYFARCDKILLTTDLSFTPSLIGGASNVVHNDDFLGLIPFGNGNLALLRIGSGAAPLVLNNSHAVFLDEYTPSGTLVRSIPMPVAVSGTQKRLTMSVSSTDHTEGYLSLSPDGKYLALAGYDAAPDYASVAASAGTTVNRVIGLVNYRGEINTSTALTTFSGVAVRSAVTSDGTNIWVTGAGNGIRYTTLGSGTSTTVTTLTGRVLSIFGNQLYASTTATGARIATVGTGLPQTSGHTLTNLNGISATTGSPYGLYAADLSSSVAGIDVIYVADEYSSALTKYSLVGGTWVSNGTIGVSSDQYRGLTGRVGSSGVELFATRKNAGATGGGGQLVKVSDSSGYNGTFSATVVVLASAPANTIFRGVALVPQ